MCERGRAEWVRPTLLPFVSGRHWRRLVPNDADSAAGRVVWDQTAGPTPDRDTPPTGVPHTGPVAYLKQLPFLYYVTVALVLLALWSGDMLGIYVAGACFVVGTVQYVRTTGSEKPRGPTDR